MKTFYRSTKDKWISGVCGGLGEHFSKDPLLIRILFIVLSLLSGIGIVLYLLLWILAPVNPET